MAIKLFIKEHLSYIVFQVLLTLFLLLLFWLDGFRNTNTAIYAIAISILLILSFLVVRYMLRRRYLAKITELHVCFCRFYVWRDILANLLKRFQVFLFLLLMTSFGVPLH